MAKDNFMLSMRMETLAVFRDLLEDPVMNALKNMLYAADKAGDTMEAVRAYSSFAAALYRRSPNLSLYIRELVLDDENFYVRAYANGRDAAPAVEESLASELALLQELAELTSEDVQQAIDYHGFLPRWETTPCDLAADYAKRLEELPQKGFGIYAKYHTFQLQGDKIVPVRYPDRQQLDDLFGYERERRQIITNVEALLSGRGCNNMLLYGDAGTGKSSTIKAVANAYADQGLRLLEVKKNQIEKIPAISDDLASLPLKFILFIDDLSFAGGDDNFSALKAILEGSVSSGGDNTAIFATSNRRHLIRESMQDRTGDDLHVNDTLQETSSLAARFGLTIVFQRPDREGYLAIVDELAKRYGLDMAPEELHQKAETHALRHNGRTPRLAKQFVELLKSGL